jgi:RNA polymerase-binding transcription factor DksA
MVAGDGVPGFLFAQEEPMQDTTQALLDEKDRLAEQIARLEQVLAERPDDGPGQGNPAATRWDVNLALLVQSRKRAQEIEQALSRAKRGDYGICRECGEPIHPDRLAVLPSTKLCIRCARASERAPASAL